MADKDEKRVKILIGDYTGKSLADLVDELSEESLDVARKWLGKSIIDWIKLLEPEIPVIVTGIIIDITEQRPDLVNVVTNNRAWFYGQITETQKRIMAKIAS